MPKSRKTLGGKSRKALAKKMRSTRMRRNKKNIKFGGTVSAFPNDGAGIAAILKESGNCENFEEVDDHLNSLNPRRLLSRSQLNDSKFRDQKANTMRLNRHALISLCP
jgi:hypothetical protein